MVLRNHESEKKLEASFELISLSQQAPCTPLREVSCSSAPGTEKDL